MGGGWRSRETPPTGKPPLKINRKGKEAWYDPAPEFKSWPSARNGELLENPVYTPEQPDIWERPVRLETFPSGKH